jgi:hypothetical protein
VKPVSLNQLLFHPRCDTLTFFLTPSEAQEEHFDLDGFIDDMCQQLELQGRGELQQLLVKLKTQIKKIYKAHPSKSHGFFLAHDLQGYTILEMPVFESFCVMGSTFHVRPLLEELYTNPEFLLVNISLYDIKIYRGDFQHLEIIQHFEFDQLPKGMDDESRSHVFTPQFRGLIPYKTILALKTIAHKVSDLILYDSLPVIVTGLDEMKELFLRYFGEAHGVISHIHEDFYEKTCVQILERCKSFRHLVMDYYSAQLKERLKRMMKSRRILTDLGEIIRATIEGKIIHLVLPTERKLYGAIDFATGQFELHKKAKKELASTDILNEIAEEVIRQGGRIQILRPHFFPQDAHVLAVLKG